MSSLSIVVVVDGTMDGVVVKEVMIDEVGSMAMEMVVTKIVVEEATLLEVYHATFQYLW